MTRRESWARIGELEGTCADAAGGLAVLPDGSRLAIGHADGTVRCVDLATGETVWLGDERHEPVLQSLACSPYGRLVATSAIWDARTGRSLERFALDAPYAHRVSWAPDGTLVAASLCGDRVRLWDTRAALAARFVAPDG